jgi:uncharacterized protein (DUF302 family)
VKTLLISVVFLLAVSITASADNGLVTVPSKYSVAETIDRFEAAAKAEKFQIFTRVDFQPLAAANGGNVRPNQLLIFGRGGVLPPLLPSTPMVAIDLPFKAACLGGCKRQGLAHLQHRRIPQRPTCN